MIKLTVLFFYLMTLSTIFSNQSWAFSQLIRHGYVNCISCHVSPNGGGVLNPYGRELSKEVLSTWGTDSEAKPFYNLFRQPNWIDSGAFVRSVQTFQNNAAVKSGYYWWMQAEGEGALHFGPDQRWTFDLSFGVSPDVLNGLQVSGASPFVSHRHYLLYRLNDYSTLRAGKFLLDYGVYFQDHTIPTRQGIGLDQGRETYNLEYSYQAESLSASATMTLGRIDNPSLLTEKGFSATGAVSFLSRYKLGLNGYWGTQNGASRELTGIYALLGFSSAFYFVGEVDLQLTQPVNSPSTTGLVSYSRVGYDIIQGLQIYLAQENFIYDFSNQFNPSNVNPQYGIYANRVYGFGPGIYWFPRPHIYFQLQALDQWSEAFPSAQLSGYFTGNIYL